MECNAPSERWRFRISNDKTPEEDELLNFCLRFDDGVVTGTVADSLGDPISDDDSVTGVRRPIGNTGRDAMDLNFRWDQPNQAIKVFLGGTVFEESNVTQFEGRFRAFAITAHVSRVVTLAAPEDGDTGTGTGTQT